MVTKIRRDPKKPGAKIFWIRLLDQLEDLERALPCDPENAPAERLEIGPVISIENVLIYLEDVEGRFRTELRTTPTPKLSDKRTKLRSLRHLREFLLRKQGRR